MQDETGKPLPPNEISETMTRLQDLMADTERLSLFSGAIGQLKLTVALGNAAVRAIEGQFTKEKFVEAAGIVFEDWKRHFDHVMNVRAERSAEEEKREAEESP